jgi:hypothetical protein
MKMTIVVDAEGCYGTHATVWFVGDRKAAEEFAKQNRNVQIVRGVSKKKVGEKISREALRTLRETAGCF